MKTIIFTMIFLGILGCSKADLYKQNEIVTEEDIQDYPEILQKYLEYSGVVGNYKVQEVKLKQKGQMQLYPKEKWMNFKANQTFNLIDHSFIWKAKIFPVKAIDKFKEASGSMTIKFLGIIRISKADEKTEITQGSALRYLGEMIWTPSGFLSKNITWEEISFLELKATLTIGEESYSGIFTFNEMGAIIRFEAERYFDDNGNFKLEHWTCNCYNYKEFYGFSIPAGVDVTWNLEEGDYTYFKLDDLTSYELIR